MCFSCGMAITTQETATQITGTTVDFIDRLLIGNTEYFMCTQCSERIKEYISGGMEKAVQRREQQIADLQEIDLTDLQAHGLIIGS